MILNMEIENFMRFRKVELDFTGKKIIGIVGSHFGNFNKSNRACKSGLIEAILYNLYGKSRTETETKLINWHYKDDMFVKCSYEIHGKTITIKRGRTLKNKPILEVTGVEYASKKEVQEEIDALFGQGYEDFIRLNYFLQADINNFMNSKPAEKSRYLTKWQNINWDQEFDYCKGKLNEIKTELEKYNAIIENLDFDQDELDKVEKALSKKEKAVEGLKGEKEKHKKIYYSIVEAKNKVSKLKGRQDILKHELETIDEKQKQINELDKEIKSIKLSGENWNGKAYEKEQEVRKLEDERRDIHYKIESKRESAENKSSECPLLKIHCKDLEEGNEKLQKKLTLEIKELEGEMVELTKKVEAQSSELTKLRKKAESEREKKTKKTFLIREKEKITVPDPGEIKEQLKGIQEEINEVKDESEKDESESQERVNELDKEIENYYEEISDLSSRCKGLEEAKYKLEKYGSRVEIFEESKQVYQFLTHTFSKKGLPSFQLENNFIEIEDEVNFILSKLGVDMQVECNSYRELNRLEDMCRCGFVYEGQGKKECPDCNRQRQKEKREELSIKILEGAKVIDFDLDSGGGRAIISLAIRIALAKFMIERGDCKNKILFLDEVAGMLDQENRKKVLLLILNVLLNIGFEQIFIISHTDIIDSLNDTIVVNRLDKNSEVNWK